VYKTNAETAMLTQFNVPRGGRRLQWGAAVTVKEASKYLKQKEEKHD
jgi:hypothetical protein